MAAKIEKLELSHVYKSFDNINALTDIGFVLNKGHVCGLLGENGAGKSTLMKILNGVLQPDKGEIRLNGEPIRFSSPSKAKELGIEMVYQELNMLPNLSVMENIYISQLHNNRAGYIRWKALRLETIEWIEKLKVDLDPDIHVGKLKVAHQQIVAIIRALATNCSLLILDEPTSALTAKDTQTLLDLLRRLKELDYIIIFISHKLDEVLQISDEVVVIRNGEKVGMFPTCELSQNQLAELIAGRKLEKKFPKVKYPIGDVILDVQNVTVPGLLEDISFTLCKGKILGFSGLLGSGKTEVAKLLFGVFGGNYSGKIYLNSKLYKPANPKKAVKAGIGLIPENRAKEGLITSQNVFTNIIIASLSLFSTIGIIRGKNSNETADSFIKSLHIKCNDQSSLIRSLSGGNQQKVVLAKWLAARSQIIIFDEPTRGIDVGAKVEVYNLMNDLVEKGVGVILMSSENDEIYHMSDNICILKNGRVTAMVSAEDITLEKMDSLM